MNMLELIKEGGVIMIPLFICSVLVWTVFLEKFFFLRRVNREIELLFERAQGPIRHQRFDEAKELCHQLHPLVSTPFLTMIDGRGNRKGLEQRIERRLLESQVGFKRYLWMLGTISNAAPFIGLFGTVVGIIKSFDSIAMAQKSGFAVVASGLSEALIATAAGILVAVMAVIIFNFFQVKLNLMRIDFRHKIADLSDLIS